ncbi:MAG TPA: energy transducer TonB [Acidobacteriaceae bacterium]
MLTEAPTRHSFIHSTGVSLAAHILLVIAIAGLFHRRPIRVFSLPGTASGRHIELVYLPGRAPAPTLHPVTKVRPTVSAELNAAPPMPAPAPTLPAVHLPPRPHLTVTDTAPRTDESSPVSATPDQTKGTDSWGSGDVEIAFTTYSPSPVPDLSVLPHGAQGDVVLDVTINPDGKVGDLAVLKTLGYGIESNVVSTVRTWVFRPATKGGIPIASVQELHFHFGPV